MHKSGCSKDPANYRPISILTVISKLLDKHIHNLLLLYYILTPPYPNISGNLLLVDRLLQPCSPSLTTAKQPLVTRSSLYFLTYAKPLIRSLTCHSCKSLQDYTYIILSGKLKEAATEYKSHVHHGGTCDPSYLICRLLSNSPAHSHSRSLTIIVAISNTTNQINYDKGQLYHGILMGMVLYHPRVNYVLLRAKLHWALPLEAIGYH